MKRTISALLLVILLLTGCGATGGATSNNMAFDSAPEVEVPKDNGYYSDGDYNYGWNENASPESGVVNDSSVSSSAALSNAKMIYTADLTLETRDFDRANSDLAALVSSMGGFFESRELNQGGTYRSVYCVVRIPADRFAEFLEQSGEVAHMTYCNQYSKNVSETYYDLEARLTTQRTKLARLQELLAQAKDMADIITLESAISETELQIEYLTGSLRSYDSLIAYSTVNVSLREVYRLSDEEVAPVTFGDRVSAAFVRGMEQCVDNLEDLVIYVARNWLNLIVWGAVIAGGVTLFRRWRRKHRGEVSENRKKRPASHPDETEEK